MSLNSTYHKITGYATLLVLLWNIVGWLGFGLVLNHSHTHDGGTYCEITFCSCEVDEGETVCTCHHNTPATDNDHDGDDTHGEFCYYDLPHNNNTDTTQALIFSSKVNATCTLDLVHIYPNELEITFIPTTEHELNGAYHDLFRPPRV
ncbi:MAG: hypothetical protein U5K71_00520 [Gracilimonas sp.]|nr:hypothetical protein [Gracilimonas sp.]